MAIQGPVQVISGKNDQIRAYIWYDDAALRRVTQYRVVIETADKIQVELVNNGTSRTTGTLNFGPGPLDVTNVVPGPVDVRYDLVSRANPGTWSLRWGTVN